MAIEEEYGFGIINEGQAIAVARNVKVRPNEFVMPALGVFNLAARLAPSCKWHPFGGFTRVFALARRSATITNNCRRTAARR